LTDIGIHYDVDISTSDSCPMLKRRNQVDSSKLINVRKNPPERTDSKSVIESEKYNPNMMILAIKRMTMKSVTFVVSSLELSNILYRTIPKKIPMSTMLPTIRSMVLSLELILMRLI